MVSVPPPAAEGTISVTGLAELCACSASGPVKPATTAAATTAARNDVIMTDVLPRLSLTISGPGERVHDAFAAPRNVTAAGRSAKIAAGRAQDIRTRSREDR